MMTDKNSIRLTGEPATLAFAASMAPLLSGGGLIFLEGTLGAGKTTLSRGLIQAMGHDGAVKSPTYTLVEEYHLPGLRVCHFDLYRLGDPEELEYMGIREYLDEGTLCLVEWADKGAGVLPEADLVIRIDDIGDSRILSWDANTPTGERWSNGLAELTEK